MSLVFHANRIHFGRGALGAALHAEIRRRDLARFIILADRNTVGDGQLERLKDVLPSDIDVLLLSEEGGGAEDGLPSIAEVRELISLEGCDTVLAIGHGNLINRAKVVARGRLIPDIRRAGRGEASPAKTGERTPYLIAVPVDANAISALGPTITIPTDDGEMSALFDTDFVPDASVCDPDFIAEMPPAKGIAVAMHIAAEAVEAYMARGENPPAEALALNAVRRCLAYLEQAETGIAPVQGGSLLMNAAIEAVLAASKGMGAAKAVGNAVSGFVKRVIEPGEVSAVMLPVVLDFNIEDPHPVGARLSDLLPLPFNINLSAHFRQLAQRLALPTSLAELGIDRQMLPRLAKLAFRDPNTATNPVAVTERDYAAMLARAGGFEGLPI